MSQVKSRGYVFFEKEFTSEEFTIFANNFGEVYHHRDSTSNGLTKVKNIYDSKKTKQGFYEITNSALFPHTDRSTVETLPKRVKY
ncbi:MAG: hypothetical protein ACWIPI_09815 [Polaribacter sp.]